MIRYVLRRLALLPVVLLASSLATFLFLRFVPGDPAQVMLGERFTGQPDSSSAVGLALPAQYVDYLANLARGDWGRAIRTNRPVLAELGERVPATVELAVAAMIIACVAGIPAGIVAASQRHSAVDRIISGISLAGVSLPLFAIGLLLAYLFGYQLGWLPPSGRLSVNSQLDPITNAYLLDSILRRDPASFADGLRHLILPALVLSTAPFAVVVKQTRAAMLDVLAEPHVMTARAKGLSERSVLATHAWRSAASPVVISIGALFGFMLSGAILVETVFSWPGVGQYVVERVLGRDYPAVQGVVLIIAVLVSLTNLIADLLSAWIDPRARRAR